MAGFQIVVLLAQKDSVLATKMTKAAAVALKDSTNQRPITKMTVYRVPQALTLISLRSLIVRFAMPANLNPLKSRLSRAMTAHWVDIMMQTLPTLPTTFTALLGECWGCDNFY